MKQIFTGLVLGAVLILSPAAKGGNPELPINLQSADDFVILAKSGISTVPPSDITGDMGVSPITSTAITGFALILDGLGEFSTSAQVTGRIYAPDYAPPTAVKMTAAISDMETAYTNAAGRTIPDTEELGAGEIGGLTFVPGLHKWSTGVLVSSNVTLNAAGNPNAVFIFQIAGDLTIANGQSVILAGGAQAKNIFWQVAGGAGAIIGTTAHFEGVVLTATAITVNTGASFNGKLLAQTRVNLQSNTIVDSSLINQYTLTYTAGLGGSVLGDSPQFVLEGENGTMVTAVADPGFVFTGWTGTDPSSDNPRTDLNVMADITVTAQFQALVPNQFVFTYTAGLGGSISGLPIQIVNQGNDGTTVTAVPDPGFAFVSWVGTDPSLVNPRTDLNAIADITGVADRYPGMPPGSRAMQAWTYKIDSQTMDAFSRPNSSSDCPCERDAKPSIVQALHLMNSKLLQEKLASTEARARAQSLTAGKLTPEEIVAQIYLACYSRKPTDDEMKIATATFSAEGATRRSATEDVLWSLMNSAEFVFNH